MLEPEYAVGAIDAFRGELAAKGWASPLFGNAQGDALAAILGNIDQTILGEPLYRSREEKAAQLLYFVVKDHRFTDGNKRIGAFLFLLYLTRKGITPPLDPRALTALTLLIAESALAQGPDDTPGRDPNGGTNRIGGLSMTAIRRPLSGVPENHPVTMAAGLSRSMCQFPA